MTRQTILVLIDEIGKAGPETRTRQLIEALDANTDTIVVGRCYLNPSHRRRESFRLQELYGFDAQDFEDKVATFASQLVIKHRPSWVISYGWENPALIIALDRLDLPVICFVDAVPPTEAAEDQLHQIIRYAAYVVFRDQTIVDALDRLRRTLSARADAVSNLNDPFDPHSSAPPASKSGLLERLNPFSHRTLDMERALDAPRTADKLLALGRCAADAHTRGAPILRRDEEAIAAAGFFNGNLYHSDRSMANRSDGIMDYLRASRRAAPRDRALAGSLLRRPVAGFNPLIYASENANFDETSGEDPLAHFIRSGSPNGRWRHDIMEPECDALSTASGSVLMHVHLHYPDLLPGLLQKITSNHLRPKLLLTTSASDALDEVDRALRATGFDAEVETVENLGRDLWPFIDLLARGRFDGFKVIGHFHAKRSPSYVAGNVWRDFLWRHLVGGSERMMDTILDRFASDDALGLVFAEDPHLDGWEANREIASDLARRMGITVPLPHHFDYPMGTMFWVRPSALAPLRALELTRAMMPPEPIPDDGTILHALERLMPFIVTKAGFRVATTHVPGSVR